MGIPAYSLECSAMGSRERQFTTADYWLLATNLMESLLLVSDSPLPESTLFEKIKAKKVGESKTSFTTKLTAKPDNYEVGLRNEYSDSDSEPEEDYETDQSGKVCKKPSLPNSL